MDEPTYTVRVSPRARRMHLVVNATEGLTVVVPRRFDKARIAPLIASRQDWIERAQARFEAERKHLARSRAAGPPAVIELPGVEEHWQVEYELTAARGVQTRPACAGTLAVRGAIDDGEQTGEALRRFVGRRTLSGLAPRLEAMADDRGLSVTSVSVRGQRTRWASCSARGAISLNRNLAFLPPRLVSYVLLHELCHRLEMNHSPAFWRLIDAEEPDRRVLDAELRGAWRFIPHWARR